MKIAVAFGPLCLSFRGSFDFDNIRTDPRGLTGSEIGFVRIAQCLKAQGHDVTVFTEAAQTRWDGMDVRPLSEMKRIDRSFHACVAINEPDLLQPVGARVRVAECWLNDFSFCNPGFEEHVDLFLSPSNGHLHQALTNPEWRKVAITRDNPEGLGRYHADRAKWEVVPLGCDVERYPVDSAKVPGRVVYCSSPDRGLHWVLQEWPAIKRAVPHAELHVFYRLRAWIDGFQDVQYAPSIERLRKRAMYIEEALRRMRDPKWSIHVHDSVSREQIEEEMCRAEVLAYPCDTTVWSEGFSCTILEACAARACPIIMDCDAIAEIYGSAVPVAPRGDLDAWRFAVVSALKDKGLREDINEHARALAETMTWELHTSRLVKLIEARL